MPTDSPHSHLRAAHSENNSVQTIFNTPDRLEAVLPVDFTHGRSLNMISICEDLDGRAKRNAMLGEMARSLRLDPIESRRHGVGIREARNGRKKKAPSAVSSG
jgi:hypothetical protein